MQKCVTLVTAILLMGAGCHTDERVARLEKENRELKDQIEKGHATADYDLQEKCSRDSKTWFKENWLRDNSTLFLDFKNHFNRASNKCFIFVEYHSKLDKSGSWSNDMTLWDVTENSKLGTLFENHFVYLKPSLNTQDLVLTCEIQGKVCKTVAEFNELLGPFLNN
jgi:hypothetical protein